MVGRAEAWEMVKQAVVDFGEKNEVYISPDDIQVMQEKLAGIHDPRLKHLFQR